MALRSRNSALAVELQVSRGTWNAPDTSDLVSGLSNLRLSIEGQTIADDSYTGSVFQNADAIAGKRVTLSFNLKLKPPTSLPAANAWPTGRLLQLCKMTEARNAAAIPVAPEALGGGSTTTAAVLGASASGTDDIYNSYPLILSDNGTTYLQKLTMIRDYVGGTKTAELMETLGSPPAANYQIPSFLAYYRDVSSSDAPVASMKIWISGYRYDLYDVGGTGIRMVAPTSTVEQSAFPEFEITCEATIYATADEATPSIPATGFIPVFKDGDMMLNRIRVGTQTFSVDLGLQSERPPNPNQPDGSDAPEITGGTATGSLTMQKYLKAYLDTLALADAQAYHPVFAQWGNAAWAAVQVGIPYGRLNFPNPDLGGGIALENVDVFIDVIDRNFAIIFPG